MSMTPLLALGWGIFGWCGNEPRPFPPNPRKDWATILGGVLGGVLGGYLAFQALGSPATLGAMEYIATALGALAAGRVLGSVAGRLGT
jgi:drug/metabolite transporter (DMT)-like permease